MEGEGRKLKTMQDEEDGEHDDDEAGTDRKMLEKHRESPKSWARRSRREHRHQRMLLRFGCFENTDGAYVC